MTALRGKKALVTGASRGIGRGIAMQLATAGADVAINYRSHPEEAAEVQKACQDLGVQAITLAADMGVQAEAEGIVEQTVERLGGLDIVVSNAVYSDRHLFYESDLSEFRKTIDVSMWGAFYLMRQASLYLMEQKKGGNIVMISSPHAVLAIPGAMAYNMAKAAIDQMAAPPPSNWPSIGFASTSSTPAGLIPPANASFLPKKRCRNRGASCPGDGSVSRKKSVAAWRFSVTRPASTSPVAR